MARAENATQKWIGRREFLLSRPLGRSPDQAAFILGIFPLLLCQNDDFYLHADNRFNKLMLYLLFSVAPLTLVLTTRAEDSLSSDGLFLTLYKEKLFAEAYSRHFARVSAMEYRVI